VQVQGWAAINVVERGLNQPVMIAFSRICGSEQLFGEPPCRVSPSLHRPIADIANRQPSGIERGDQERFRLSVKL